MTFNESNTVEAYLRDLICGGVTHHTAVGAGFARRAGRICGLGWHYLAAANVPREPHDVFVESFVRDALIHLNPEIAENPGRADEVLYKLRAIVLSVRCDGLIKANEEFTAWLRGDRSMPFGPNHEHRTVRLVDFDNLENNSYVVTQQYTYRAGPAERRADLVQLVNGFPLVLIETKTPVRPSVSWVDGALQVHDDYEKYVPELFACNVFSVASEGKELRYGSIRMPVNLWGPWRVDDDPVPAGLSDLQRSISGLLAPITILDILASFTLFATDKKQRRFKIVSRYQQYEGANQIVQRVIDGQPRKGLIWHFQGSGKSLLMVFAAQKLRMHPALKNPTVLIVVDRIDLDAQISATFHASDIPNLVKADSREELKRKLRQDTRKIIITTIFKFAEDSPLQELNRFRKRVREHLAAGETAHAWLALGRAESLLLKVELEEQPKAAVRLQRIRAQLTARGPEPEGLSSRVAAQEAANTKILNERDNIIVLVDEAHRTQEGGLGMKMRAALPNAFLFGLTGTPINRRDRNTFYAFGAEEDAHGYMSRYGFEDSIRDGATLPLHFEPRLVELHIDKEAIDQAYTELTGGLSDLDKDNLAKAASKMAVLVKVPERVAAICGDIARHFQEKVEPTGLKAMVVTFDQECCLLYKAALDRLLPPDASDVVISVSGKEKDDARYKPYKRDRDAEEKLLDRYRDPNDPLQILVVTAKLLTGFDAPILQAMYLDKPARDHTLLQAICRTNRPYTDPHGARKGHGLIIDYLGVFDDVAKALEFDEEGFRRVVSNIAALAGKLPGAVQKCLAYFPNIDRSVGGYEGLIAAQECLPNNEIRDAFAADYSYLSKLWEALSPDSLLSEHETTYRWLSQVYISVQPTTATGQLIWHEWLDTNVSAIGHHALHLLSEIVGASSGLLPRIREMVRDHYVDPALTAKRLASLGAPKTAELLREHLPVLKKARSGDLGEVLATEIAERQLDFDVPVRRLRWKDGRNMALRGDDLIGVTRVKTGMLTFLKGESKSRATLSTAVLDEAGDALDRDRGRPTRHSVLFVADRLREQGKDALAEDLEEAVLKSFRGYRVEHLLFVLTGGNPKNLLSDHLTANSNKKRRRHAVGVRIRDHGKFIADLFGGF